MTPEQRKEANRRAINAYRKAGNEPKITKHYDELKKYPETRQEKLFFFDGFLCGVALSAIVAVIVVTITWGWNEPHRANRLG